MGIQKKIKAKSIDYLKIVLLSKFVVKRPSPR